MATDVTVKEQFGWLPLSVVKPERREDLRALVQDTGDHTTRRGDTAKYLPGLRFSEFNPDLAEKVVRYWSEPGALVVDPFAGRGTRGVIALHLGRRYVGYEVAPTTFSNGVSKGLTLYNADGCLLQYTEDETADLVFTCPPYHRLERYETAPAQLSDLKGYDDFIQRIQSCAENVVRVLRPGGFVCWVCADWRDGTAFRTFHVDSIEAFRCVGATLHDVVVVHNNSPFAPLQAAKVAAKRYTSKVHEYLLVFRK